MFPLLPKGPTSLENALKFWLRAKLQCRHTFSKELTCLTQLTLVYIPHRTKPETFRWHYRNLSTPSHLLYYKHPYCQLPSPK